MFYQFHQGLMTIPDQFGVYRKLLSALMNCLVIQENVYVPIFVALFYFLHCACLDSIYFYLEYHGVEPMTEAMPLMPPFQAPSIHSNKSAFIGLVDLE